jgi:hypothetical protein
MPIYLDGQAVDLPGDNLGAVLDAAQQRLEPAGRVLVEVLLNGEPLLGEQLDTNRDVVIGDAKVHLESADPRELAEATLEQVRLGLMDARELQLEAADLFQQDKSNEAMQHVGRAIEAWQQAQQAVLQSTLLLGIDLDKQTFDGRPMNDLTDALLNQLKGLRDLISAGDTVGLADSLAYEWPAMTDRWDRLIRELIRWLGPAK